MSNKAQERLSGALGIVMWGTLAAQGGLWVVASHKFFGANFVSTAGALIVFMVLFAAIFAVALMGGDRLETGQK